MSRCAHLAKDNFWCNYFDGTPISTECFDSPENPCKHKVALSNFESIRAFSDMEMAIFLARLSDCDCCPIGPTRECAVDYDTCINKWLTWLKEDTE